MGDYYCTNCGADLEDQFGFDPDSGHWTCTECGQFLTDPDDFDEFSRFDGVGWFCDGCGAYLNKQSGFSDWYSSWTCTECGHTNNLSEDEIYESEEDYQNSKNDDYGGSLFGAIAKGVVDGMHEAVTNYRSDDSDDEEDDDEYSDYDYSSSSSEGYSNNIYAEELHRRKIERERQIIEQQIRQAEIEQAKKDKRSARWKRVWSAIAHKKMIGVNVSSGECIGVNYLKVIALFEKNGFTKIRTNIIEDLEYSERASENMVTEVMINGSNYFENSNQAKYDSDIVVSFHKLKRVHPPLSYKEAKSMPGPDVMSEFDEAGFVDIRYNEIKDLTFGFLKKDGAIESIILGEDKKFKSDMWYRIDTPLVVSYHTFKKKK